jgi:cell division protein FtsI (penicillin-binding protein 3)
MILGRAAWVQVVNGPQLRSMARNMNLRNDTLFAERGNIYSEDGVLLCSTIPQFDLHIDFSVIKKDTFDKYKDTLAESFSAILKDKSKAAYLYELTAEFNDTARYYELAHNLPYYDYQLIKQLPIMKLGSRRGGLVVEQKNKRINPFNVMALRTIGLWRKNSQVIGLEATYDSVLKGANGYCIKQRMPGGQWMIIQGSEQEPTNGFDLVTTLDVSIQDIAEHALESQLSKFECLYGTCIVMEVKTGKVKAIANLGRQKDGSYWEDFNYAMIPTEPGSTFKLMTLLSLFNDKHITVEDQVNAQGGSASFGNRTMKDSHLGLGVLSVKQAFALSSNVAMAKLAYQFYAANPTAYTNFLKKLQLDQKTGIDLLGERKPVVKTPLNKSWSATSLPWMATGYEVMIAPLRTCMIYNAVANNGTMMKPYLVNAIRSFDKDVQVFEPEVVVPQIASKDAIRQARQALEEVVLTGTGKHIQSPFYSIAGKTGTAQVADKGITYTDGVYQGSFVGYFPANNPTYTIAVVIRTKPHSGAYYGGTIAAPVFRMIADKIYANSIGQNHNQLDSLAKVNNSNVVAVAQQGSKVNKILQALNYKYTNTSNATWTQLQDVNSTGARSAGVPIYANNMPDLSNMHLSRAIALLEACGLKVEVKGVGQKVSQSILPGQKIVKGQKVTITLN